MKYFFLLFFTTFSLYAFETTNVQLLHSNQFDGDVFIYDTQSEKKTTLTLEHYRTWDYGDFFMFADLMSGKKFDSTSSGVYTEASPRFSFSKLFDKKIATQLIQDIYLSTQLNLGRSYQAYLYGVGIDLNLPYSNLFSLNLYNKDENIYSDNSYQVTLVYATKEFYNFHIEGFVDLTKRDLNTQNQLLYSVDKTNQTYIGVEWLYYKYNYDQSHSKTSVIQAMLKYKF